MTTLVNNNNEKSTSKTNKASSLLSSEENDLVFTLLGKKCQSLCTAVCQLYQTDSPNHTKWIKKHTGVLCFVKDNGKRSYYCRVYCLVRQELMWEIEMYDTIDIARPRPYLLSFEGQDGIVGLNFANEEECESFLHISTTTVANRNRRREERKRRSGSGVKKEPPARPPPVANSVINTNNLNNNYLDNTDATVTLRNPVQIPKLISPQIPLQSTTYNSNNNKKDKNRNEKKKLTKADIGQPSNFKHITHVGWNAQSGFDLTGEDESLKPFLQKAGVSENQLKDRRTRDFIYDFIQNHNVAEVVKKEKSQKTTPPPPVPSRHQNQTQSQNHLSNDQKQRLAPPPPPPSSSRKNSDISRNESRNGRHERHEKQMAPPPPVPNTNSETPQMRIPITRGPPPSRPPPINLNHNNSSASAPAPPPAPPPPPPMAVPPPPPPMLTNNNNVEKSTPTPQLPVVPDVRSALMESIRKGTQLKKVDQTSTASTSSGDSRSELMSEIRQGVELRPTTRDSNSAGNRSSGGGTVAGTDALAEALRKALEKRSGALRAPSSDEDSSTDSDNDGEWSD